MSCKESDWGRWWHLSWSYVHIALCCLVWSYDCLWCFRVGNWWRFGRGRKPSKPSLWYCHWSRAEQRDRWSLALASSQGHLPVQQYSCALSYLPLFNSTLRKAFTPFIFNIAFQLRCYLSDLCAVKGISAVRGEVDRFVLFWVEMPPKIVLSDTFFPSGIVCYPHAVGYTQIPPFCQR